MQLFFGRILWKRISGFTEFPSNLSHHTPHNSYLRIFQRYVHSAHVFIVLLNKKYNKLKLVLSPKWDETDMQNLTMCCKQRMARKYCHILVYSLKCCKDTFCWLTIHQTVLKMKKKNEEMVLSTGRPPGPVFFQANFSLTTHSIWTHSHWLLTLYM